MDALIDTAPVPPPLRVVLKHEEVMAAALASNSRVRGGGTWFSLGLFLLLCLAIWSGHVASFWLVQQLPLTAMVALGPWLPIVIPAYLGLIAVQLALGLEQRRAGRVYLNRLAAIGAPLEREGTYEVTREALVLTTERLVLAPRWHAIDTVERGEHGWVLSADQLHFLIPFAAFPDPVAQRPLLRAITDRMTAEARARSREAVEFAEAEVRGAPPPPEARAPGSDSRERALPESADIVPDARGWLTLEQARWAAAVMHGRMTNEGIHRWAYPLTGGVTGFVLAGLAVAVIGLFTPGNLFLRNPGAAALAGFLLLLTGAAIGLGYGYKRLAIVLEKAWRAELDDRGVPPQEEATWRLGETGIAYLAARFSGEARYESIHQVLHEHGYWIIGADALTLCIPDAAFPSDEAARAFMAALRARMRDDARARSVAVDAPAR